MAIKRYTIEQMKKLKSQTDWEAIKNMKDENIDTSDPDAPDAAELIEKGLAHRIDRPKQLSLKQQVTVDIDADIAQKLRAQGAGWQTLLSKKISQWAMRGFH
jgi:uncharacterized protein (DUF4415 family)